MQAVQRNLVITPLLGEKDQENPLPWDKIDPADYNIWDGYVGYEEAIENSKKRMAKSEQIKLIEQNAKWIKEQSEDDTYSLNFDRYAADAEKNKEVALEQSQKYTLCVPAV